MRARNTSSTKNIITMLGVLISAVLLSFGLPVRADDDAKPIPIANVKHDGPVEFEKEILPILRRSCLACHNASEAEGDLVLETPQTAIKGGSEGPAIVPGNSMESLLLKVASHMSEPIMPPPDNDVKAKNLTPDQLGLIKRWIDEGAKGEVKASGPVAWQPLPAGVNPIYAVAISPRGNYVAAGRANQIFIYHVPTKSVVGRLSDPQILNAGLYDRPGVAHLDLVNSLAFSPDGKRLASGGYRNVKIWQRPSAIHRASLAGVAAPIESMAVSVDEELVALGLQNGKIKLSDLKAGKIVRTLEGHAGPVTGLSWTTDGKLISGSADRTIRLWNTGTGKQLARSPTVQSIDAITLIAGEKQVAVAEADNTIRIWPVPGIATPPVEKSKEDDAASEVPQALAEIKGHTSSITSLATINASGTQILSGSLDGTIRSWDIGKAKMIRSFSHAAPVLAVAVNVDGTQFVSAGAYNLAKVWNAADGKLLATTDRAYQRKYKEADINREIALAKLRVRNATTDLTEAKKRKQSEIENALKAEETLAKTDPKAEGKVQSAQRSVARSKSAVKKATDALLAAEATSKQEAAEQKRHEDALAAVKKAVTDKTALIRVLTASKVAADKAVLTAQTKLTAAEKAKDAAAKVLADAETAARTSVAGGEKSIIAVAAVVADAIAKQTVATKAAIDAAAKVKTAMAAKAANDKAATNAAAAAKAASDAKVAADKALADAQAKAKAATDDAAKATAAAAVKEATAKQEAAAKLLTAANEAAKKAVAAKAATDKALVDAQAADKVAATAKVAADKAVTDAQAKLTAAETAARNAATAAMAKVTAAASKLATSIQAVGGAKDQSQHRAALRVAAEKALADATAREKAAKSEIEKKLAAAAVQAATAAKAAADKVAADSAAASQKATTDRAAAFTALTQASSALKAAQNAAKKANDAAATEVKKAADAKAAADKKSVAADARVKAAATAKTAADKLVTDAQAKLKAVKDGKSKTDSEAELKTAMTRQAMANKEVADADAAQTAAAAAKMAGQKNVADAQAKAKTIRTETGKSVADVTTIFNQARSKFAAADLAAGGAKAVVASAELAKVAANQALAAYLPPIRDVAISADGLQIATASDDQTVRTWSAFDGSPIETFTSSNASVSFVAFGSEETLLSAGDKTLSVWDTQPEWQLERMIGNFNSPNDLIDRVTALHFSPDGTLLATGSGVPTRNGELKIWNVADGTLVREISSAHSDSVYGIEFSPSGKRIASCSADRFMKVFQVADGKFIKAFEGHTHHVLGVSWRADGRLLATSGADKVVKVWDFRSGDQKKSIVGFNREVTGIQYLGVTDSMVVSCGDQSVLTKTSAGGRGKSFAGVSDFMYSVRISLDGNRVVAGGQDSIVRIWKNDGTSIVTFERPKSAKEMAAEAAAKNQSAAK